MPPGSLLAQIFKSDVGPDGNARDELDVACTVDHPNLTKSLGIIHASPSSGSSSSGGPSSNGSSNGGGGGGMEKFQWLVMERVVGQPLAEKPDFSSVLRCRWGSGRRFEPVLVLAVLLQVRVCVCVWMCVPFRRFEAPSFGVEFSVVLPRWSFLSLLLLAANTLRWAVATYPSGCFVCALVWWVEARRTLFPHSQTRCAAMARRLL